MLDEQPQELHARVAGTADDARLDHGPVPKHKSRPEAAFDSQKLRSTFRVLLAPPRLVQAHLLSLHFARVARDQARRAEGALQPRIILDQCTRDAVTHGSGLAALAAAVDVDQDV